MNDDQESEKSRSDRQLAELLNELRVALPGAQILLAFILTVPFATRFGRTSRTDRVTLFVALLATMAGTLLLLAPSVYHRLRWQQGGKLDVVRVGNRLFLVGTACLAVGLVAALFMVSDVLFGMTVAIISALALAALALATWYVLPLIRSKGVESIE